MFNLQGGEIIIILLLALVVLGPEKLPDAMRKMGQFYAELRKLSSGFQSEFRAAVDEPLREIRDTANTLRDSADFTKLQQGERDEKPKSAGMGAAADPEPVAETPDFDTPTADAGKHEPSLAEDSKPAPFSQNSSAAPRPTTEPTPVPAPPAPFTGMSSAAPRPEDASADPDADGSSGGQSAPADDEVGHIAAVTTSADDEQVDEGDVAGDATSRPTS